MSDSIKSYRQIIKATSIFGGVQVFQIIISIVRSKFVAVLLGPTGMGIAGLLNATLNMMASLTNFGLSTSAIKDISAAHSSNNNTRLRVVFSVFNRLVWITGVLGFVLTVLLSAWLSEFTFGNRDYTWSFVLISITLLLNQICNGQSVVLRGMRKISYMAQSTLIGSAIGLVTTVPLYYFYGIDGIVPAIIVTALTSLILTWLYFKKLKLKTIYVSNARTLVEGRSMLKMGFLINLSTLIALAASYIIRIFINMNGGLEQVGLYNAGFAIITTYVGMIFTAMSSDYYPRLASVAHSNTETREIVSQQAEIAILILAPILTIFLVFINWVIIILYSTKFLEVTTMIYWAALGMLFKAVSWSIGFIFLTKGTAKLFFWNELIINTYVLFFNLLGYYYGGLTGLGISFLAAYFVYLIQVYFVAKLKFDFFFNSSFTIVFLIQLGIVLLSFITVYFLAGFWLYFVGFILIGLSSWYSFMELDKRLNLKSMLTGIKAKYKK